MTIDDIGEIEREFKPGMENVIAGVIIGLLLVVAGAGLACLSANGVIASGGNLPVMTEQRQKGWSWVSVGLLGALGVGMIFGGSCLIRGMRSLVSLRVCIGRHGFSVADKSTKQSYSWDDIVSVQETHIFERPPILKGAAKYVLPKMKSKGFIVFFAENEFFGFDGNSIKGHTRLARMIKQETDKRDVPWNIVEEHV